MQTLFHDVYKVWDDRYPDRDFTPVAANHTGDAAVEYARLINHRDDELLLYVSGPRTAYSFGGETYYGDSRLRQAYRVLKTSSGYSAISHGDHPAVFLVRGVEAPIQGTGWHEHEIKAWGPEGAAEEYARRVDHRGDLPLRVIVGGSGEPELYEIAWGCGCHTAVKVGGQYE